MAKKGTYVYTLKRSNEIVYVGITNDPDRRLWEHEEDGKDFTHMRVEHGPRSRSQALDIEREWLRQYKRSHYGDPPEYNEE